MEILGTLQSLKQARRFVDEIALSGEWQADNYGEFGLNYIRRKDGLTERISIVKKDERRYDVVKEVLIIATPIDPVKLSK